MEKNSQIKTRQMPFMKQIAKFSSRQYFPLYGIRIHNIHVHMHVHVHVRDQGTALCTCMKLYSNGHTPYC